MSHLIYMDNAATTFPKPPNVLEDALAFYRKYGVNPGRSGTDLAREAEAMVAERVHRSRRFLEPRAVLIGWYLHTMLQMR